MREKPSKKQHLFETVTIKRRRLFGTVTIKRRIGFRVYQQLYNIYVLVVFVFVLILSSLSTFFLQHFRHMFEFVRVTFAHCSAALNARDAWRSFLSSSDSRRTALSNVVLPRFLAVHYCGCLSQFGDLSIIILKVSVQPWALPDPISHACMRHTMYGGSFRDIFRMCSMRIIHHVMYYIWTAHDTHMRVYHTNNHVMCCYANAMAHHVMSWSAMTCHGNPCNPTSDRTMAYHTLPCNSMQLHGMLDHISCHTKYGQVVTWHDTGWVWGQPVTK